MLLAWSLIELVQKVFFVESALGQSSSVIQQLALRLVVLLAVIQFFSRFDYCQSAAFLSEPELSQLRSLVTLL